MGVGGQGARMGQPRGAPPQVWNALGAGRTSASADALRCMVRAGTKGVASGSWGGHVSPALGLFGRAAVEKGPRGPGPFSFYT